MNQMYLNDIDLMKFEHSIRSDLDMFMIECYEDYYYEAEGTKEGIFQKIKRKIKEIFEKLKAVFRGKKVQQMDRNIEMAQKAAQNIPATKKNKKIEVFDGEKALKLIEEDHEKAKKDSKHKRLDKKKLIALCTIPVTVGAVVTILIKNKKALPKILDKEQELNKEVEQAEKQAEKAQNDAKKEVQKEQEQVKKEVEQAEKHVEKRVEKVQNEKEREERKKFMSDYKKEARNAKRSANRGILSVPDSFATSKEEYITNINETDKRFITYQEKIFGKQTKALVGLYTIIIDTSTKTAKEIIDMLGQHNIAYIKNVKVDSDYVEWRSTLWDGCEYGLDRSLT